MRTYFYSGSTRVIDGVSKSQCGTVSVESDDDSPGDIFQQLMEDKEKQFGETFILTAFNRIDESC